MFVLMNRFKYKHINYAVDFKSYLIDVYEDFCFLKKFM